VSLTALTERVHSDGAIPPGRKYFLLMYYVNNTIDLVMFNRFWPKPLEAKGDMLTDNDDARPEEYRRNRNASVVDEAEGDEEEQEEEHKEEHDNEE